MKILVVSSYFGNAITGALNFIKVLTEDLSKRGHSVDLALDSRYKDKYHIEGPNVLWFDSIPLTAYSPSISLLKILQKTDADLVHLHGYMSFQSDFGSLISTLRRIPTVLTPHGSLLGYEHLYESTAEKLIYYLHDFLTLKIAARFAKFVVATSTSEFKDVIDFGVESEKIQLIPLPFELKNNLQIPKNSSDGIRKLLFVGRIVPNKHLEILIHALNLVLKKNRNIQLNIVGEEITGKLVGDSGYKQKIINLVNELGITENVKFLGWQKDEKLWTIYRNSDLMLCLSTYENFSLPILEAASFGVPIISTDVGVARDIIGDNEGGRIIQLDHNQVANAILDYLNNDIIYNNASSFVLERSKKFSISSVVDSYEKIFMQTIEMKKSLRRKL